VAVSETGPEYSGTSRSLDGRENPPSVNLTCRSLFIRCRRVESHVPAVIGRLPIRGSALYVIISSYLMSLAYQPHLTATRTPK